jgi:hypothetical protein
VTDRTELDTSGSLPARRGRLLVILTSVLLLAGSAVVGYLLGRDIASRPLATALELLHTLQPETQRLKAQIAQQGTTIISLETKLKKAETALRSMSPKENTYTVNANQSLNVADGTLNIGLVGAPTNNTVNININGKQYSAVTGDVFNVTPDPQTQCQIRVQSFDMFEATVIASCAKAKPK